MAECHAGRGSISAGDERGVVLDPFPIAPVAPQSLGSLPPGWLLTFGDLLTLLLCFFVVGLSHDLRPTPTNTEQKQLVNPTSVSNTDSDRVGIVLAPSLGQVGRGGGESEVQRGLSVTELTFARADLFDDGTLQPLRFQEFREFVRAGPKAVPVIVTVCAWSDELAGGGMERRLTRQLSDGGVRGFEVRFTLPERCPAATLDEAVLKVRR